MLAALEAANNSYSCFPNKDIEHFTQIHRFLKSKTALFPVQAGA